MVKLTLSGRGSELASQARVGVEPTRGKISPQEGLAAGEQRAYNSNESESLELYREMLFSISDAVLVADEAGRLVWACPNVFHSFRCSAEELMTLGTVEGVFGKAIFSPEDLRERGELANIETAIRDKEGDEHILLVTVKQVQIGRGRLLCSCRDITERRRAEEALGKANEQLARDRESLRRKNAALQEVLSRMGASRRRIIRQVRANMDRAILPLLEDLRTGLDAERLVAVDLLTHTLRNITAPFLQTFEARYPQLSPREVTICNLIRNGFSTKEIACSLHTSEETVRTQRKAIRRKLGARGSGDSLAAVLRGMVLTTDSSVESGCDCLDQVTDFPVEG